MSPIARLLVLVVALAAAVGCGSSGPGKLKGAVYFPSTGAVVAEQGEAICKAVALTFSRPTKGGSDAPQVAQLPANAVYSPAQRRCEYEMDWEPDGGTHPWNIRVEYNGTLTPATDQKLWDEVFPVTVTSGEATRQDFYLRLPGKTGLPNDYCTNSGDCTKGLSCDGGLCLVPGHKNGGEAERCAADTDCTEGRTCVGGRCGTCTTEQVACDRFAPADSVRASNACCNAGQVCDIWKSPPVCAAGCQDNGGCGPSECCDPTWKMCRAIDPDKRGEATGTCPPP